MSAIDDITPVGGALRSLRAGHKRELKHFTTSLDCGPGNFIPWCTCVCGPCGGMSATEAITMFQNAWGMTCTEVTDSSGDSKVALQDGTLIDYLHDTGSMRIDFQITSCHHSCAHLMMKDIISYPDKVACCDKCNTELQPWVPGLGCGGTGSITRNVGSTTYETCTWGTTGDSYQ